MRFNTEKEKQAYIHNLEQEISERIFSESASETTSITDMQQKLNDMNEKIMQMLEVQKKFQAEMEAKVNARLNTAGIQETAMDLSEAVPNRFFTDKSGSMHEKHKEQLECGEYIFRTAPSSDYHN